MRLGGQLDLVRIPSAAFANRIRLTAGSAGTVQVSIYIAAIDECAQNQAPRPKLVIEHQSGNCKPAGMFAWSLNYVVCFSF